MLEWWLEGEGEGEEWFTDTSRGLHSVTEGEKSINCAVGPPPLEPVADGRTTDCEGVFASVSCVLGVNGRSLLLRSVSACVEGESRASNGVCRCGSWRMVGLASNEV